MKKRLLTILLATTMIFSLIACGDSEEADTPSDNTTENSTAENTVPEKEEPVDDGIIDFEGETFKITYTKHETGTDYEGNPCLYYYFTFVNNGEEAASAAVTSYIQCFQNGIECDIAITDEYNEQMDNYMKDIQPGIEIEVCEVFSLTDNSEVTLEASDWVSFSGEKDIQKITLE